MEGNMKTLLDFIITSGRVWNCFDEDAYSISCRIVGNLFTVMVKIPAQIFFFSVLMLKVFQRWCWSARGPSHNTLVTQRVFCQQVHPWNRQLSEEDSTQTYSFLVPFIIPDCLVGLVVKASTSRAEDPRFKSRLCQDFFRGRVIPVT